MQLYQTQDFILIIICAPITDIAWCSSKEDVTSTGHKKAMKKVDTFMVNKF